ncbi:hypothetical protein [uncultured Cellulomonas sp.]|uniref:hypothetical protein n=1 Tax=uncultured Cellulomonas sp. TaxID=189682 RepID=UPI002625D0A8|nr:hypothetical protein [uncultured Cellulomonas sp.]
MTTPSCRRCGSHRATPALHRPALHGLGRLGLGEEATVVVCMDVPEDVIQDTAVIVEGPDSWDLTAELWGLP